MSSEAANAMGEESKEKLALVPRLRFPEFRETRHWEPKSIGHSCESYSGGTPSTTNKSFYGGEIPFIRSAEIDRDETELFLTTEALENSAAKMVKEGDILVALYGANSGDVALAKVNGAINQAILCLRHETNNAFVYQYLVHRKEWVIATFIQGGQGNLSGEIIKAIRLRFPKPEEQQKIADCLSSLDELITAETQKLDALKTHKKGLMQQLFPREGETVPRLRFPEFRKKEGWEEHPVSAMLEEALRPVTMNDGEDHTLVTVKRRYGGIVLREVLKGRDILVKSQFRIRKNDFLISKRQIVHCACGVVPEDYDDAIVSNEYTILQAKKNCDIGFFHYFSQQPIVGRSFLECSVGIVIEKMLFKQDQWLKRKFLFPKLQEQQKIACCLSSLDDLITAQSQKIDALKTHKKGLMQQLFPVLDEAPA